MKHMRKILSLLLALVMVLGLAVTVSAEDAEEPTKNDSITVTGTKNGESYSLYKLFDLVVDDEFAPSAYSYKVSSDWAAFFTGAGAAYITVNERGYVTDISDAAALAKAAAEWTGRPDVTPVVADGETVVFSGLDNGYYLITSTLGTFAMTRTTPAESAVTVNEKNPDNTIDKTVKEDSTGAFGKENDAQIGDTVYFQSAVKLVKGTRNVVIHDAMDDGLTLNPESIKIEGLAKDNHYTVAFNKNDGCDFEITFSEVYLNSLTGETNLVLTYNAVLNENAIGESDIVDQQNKTTIKYGNATTVESQTITTTHKFNVFKHAAGSTDNLAGAVFQLKKGDAVVTLVKIDDNNFRVAKTGEAGVTEFTTVASGDIVIWGVDEDDDYTLVETSAPAGYNQLNAPVPVEFDGIGTRIDIENNTGTQLPGTGGMGTTIFYVLGSVLVLGALVLLVTKKRMASAE